MKKTLNFLFTLVILLIVLFSCNNRQQETFQTEWLGESHQEIHHNIEEQFQGFSRTMVETAYRYAELYWAGRDQNWEYADYQTEHIYEALEQGFVRRPERELSARSFMTVALPEMDQAIESKNQQNFLEAFNRLTNSCNTCHQMEEVAFIKIYTPPVRHSIVSY